MTTALENKLTEMITPLLEQLGFELVHLTLEGQGRGRTLQILAEDPKTQTLDLDSCAELSRTIGTHLEVEDIIKGAYRLEISSPGIARPLVKPAHYARYNGFDVQIDTHVPINNQKRYHGKITASDNDTVTVETDTKTVTLAFADIARARLKLTDALLKASRPANTLTNDEPDISDDQDEGDAEK